MNTYTVLLSGNPNVGKSTIFNALTGLHQHTGNWSGKTVGSAQGEFYTEGQRFILVDLPGTYSLTASSADEEVTRDALCFSQPDAVILFGTQLGSMPANCGSGPLPHAALRQPFG